MMSLLTKCCNQGIYPTIVIVLVGLQRTMNHTTLFQSAHLSAVTPRGTEVAPASIQFARDETLDLGDLNLEDKDPFAMKAGMDVEMDVREMTSYKSDAHADAYAI